MTTASTEAISYRVDDSKSTHNFLLSNEAKEKLGWELVFSKGFNCREGLPRALTQDGIPNVKAFYQFRSVSKIFKSLIDNQVFSIAKKFLSIQLPFRLSAPFIGLKYPLNRLYLYNLPLSKFKELQEKSISPITEKFQISKGSGWLLDLINGMNDKEVFKYQECERGDAFSYVSFRRTMLTMEVAKDMVKVASKYPNLKKIKISGVITDEVYNELKKSGKTIDARKTIAPASPLTKVAMIVASCFTFVFAYALFVATPVILKLTHVPMLKTGWIVLAYIAASVFFIPLSIVAIPIPDRIYHKIKLLHSSFTRLHTADQRPVLLNQ